MCSKYMKLMLLRLNVNEIVLVLHHSVVDGVRFCYEERAGYNTNKMDKRISEILEAYEIKQKMVAEEELYAVCNLETGKLRFFGMVEDDKPVPRKAFIDTMSIRSLPIANTFAECRLEKTAGAIGMYEQLTAVVVED